VAQVCGGDGGGAVLIRGGGCSLFGQGEVELVEQQLQVFFGVRVAREDDFASVGGGQMPQGPEPAEGHVEHLHGGELLQRGSRGQPGGAWSQPGFEGDLQGIGQEADEDVGFDAAVELMVDGSGGQVAFESSGARQMRRRSTRRASGKGGGSESIL